MRWISSICLVLGALLMMQREQAAVVEAGTVIKFEVPELVERASVVFEGKVLTKRAVLMPNGRIDTEYRIKVTRTDWGQPMAERVVRMPGGVLPDGRGMVVPGMAHLAQGEEVLLMLSQSNRDGMRVPVGLAQGKFRIATDRNGRKLAVRSQKSLTLLNRNTLELEEADNKSVFDYSAIRAEIDAAIAKKRAAAKAREGK